MAFRSQGSAAQWPRQDPGVSNPQSESAIATDLLIAAQPYVLAAWLAGVAFFGCRLLRA